MKRLTTILVLTLICLSAFGQSNKFRASGLYQKAVELYESYDYSESLSYAQKSREALEGSNEKLQYLFIMIYVKQKDWVNAHKEMQRFYDLLESREKGIYFSGTTENLTDKEEKELTKIMIDIEENAEYAISPAGQREAVAKEIEQWFDRNVIQSEMETSEKINFWMKNRGGQDVMSPGQVKIIFRMTISRQSGNTFRVQKNTKGRVPVFSNAKDQDYDVSYSFSCSNIDEAKIRTDRVEFAGGNVLGASPKIKRKAVQIVFKNSITDSDGTEYELANMPVRDSFTETDVAKLNALIKKYKEIK